MNFAPGTRMAMSVPADESRAAIIAYLHTLKEAAMDAFPAFFPLAGRTVVVAGAGPKAEAKASYDERVGKLKEKLHA